MTTHHLVGSLVLLNLIHWNRESKNLSSKLFSMSMSLALMFTKVTTILSDLAARLSFHRFGSP